MSLDSLFSLNYEETCEVLLKTHTSSLAFGSPEGLTGLRSLENILVTPNCDNLFASSKIKTIICNSVCTACKLLFWAVQVMLLPSSYSVLT